MSVSQNTPKKQKGPQPPNCNCGQDLYADLPSEMQPKNRTWKTGFRQVTCPNCSLEYWTNCEGDLCTACQKNLTSQKNTRP